MIVTDLKYNLEKRLVEKLDLMIDRVTQEHPKKDAWLCNEGGEGEGKSNSAIAEAYYIKSKTKRDIHLFMRLEEVIDFAKRTKNKIIIWDEPSLDALSSDALKETNKNLIRLAMTIRSHRHFFIINFTKFHKFSEYVVVERCLGMVHMYSRKETQAGRFVYIKKKSLEQLWNDYRTKRQRNYKIHAAFRGSFPDIIEKNFDKMGIYVNGIKNATYEMYEKEKTKGIESIGEKNKSKDNIDLINLQYHIGQVDKKDFPIKDIESMCRLLGITSNKKRRWRYIKPITPKSLENQANLATPPPENITIGLDSVEEKKDGDEEQIDDDFDEPEPMELPESDEGDEE